MKNNNIIFCLKKKLHVSILCMLALCIFVSCEGDEGNISLAVNGVWFQSSGRLDDPTLSYRNLLIFNNDGTYEESLQVVKTDDVKDVVGYLTLITGEFEVIENRLKRFNTYQYGLDDNSPYLDRDELVLVDSTNNELPEIGVILNKERDMLTLDYFLGDQECNDVIFAMCVQYQTFYKE